MVGEGGAEGLKVIVQNVVLKSGHKPNINTVFHAKKLQQFRITGRFLNVVET